MKYSLTIKSLLFPLLLFLILENGRAQVGYNKEKVAVLLESQNYMGLIKYLEGVPAEWQKAPYYYAMGLAYYGIEDIDKAVNSFEKVLTLDSTHIQAHVYLGDIYKSLRRDEESLLHYAELVKLQPENPIYSLRLSQQYAMTGKREKAFQLLQGIYPANKFLPIIVNAYYGVLIGQRDYTMATKIIDTFLTVDSSNASVIASKIDLSYRVKDFASVIKWGERLKERGLELYRPYYYLAFAYLSTKQFQQCLLLNDWLESIDLSSVDLKYSKALAYAGLRQYEKSNAVLDTCLKRVLMDDAVLYWNAKGDNYEFMKMYNKAISCYDSAYYFFKVPEQFYYSGKVYDASLKNKRMATQYYQNYLNAKGKPVSEIERKIFDYIRNYLKQ